MDIVIHNQHDFLWAEQTLRWSHDIAQAKAYRAVVNLVSLRLYLAGHAVVDVLTRGLKQRGFRQVYLFGVTSALSRISTTRPLSREYAVACSSH